MFKFSRSDTIDTTLYEERLRKDGFIVYDRDKMDIIQNYECAHYRTLASLACDIMIHHSAWRYKTLSRDAILDFLMDCEKCPEKYFKKGKTKDYSLDSKRVLEKLRINGYANEFLEYYMLYKSKKSKCGKIRNMMERQSIPAGKNKDGIDVYKISFAVSQQKNMRYNYSNDDVIAIPKEYNDCITVEDGYFLAWGDFAQSDFRIAYNLFMRSPENDKIMNEYDDKYEALARIVAKSEGKKFNLEQFKEDRSLYKQLTLATVYGTRGSVVPEQDAFIRKFYEFLKKCPKYVEYELRLQERVKLNVPVIVKSYFGHSEVCAIQYNKDDTIHDALNSPVQSCTSEVVILTTNKILDTFYSLGYTEDDISIYYVRHDEPIFKVSERVLKDIWVFNQTEQILVDNWSPLSMSFNYGYYYKVPDKELEEQVHQNYVENADKIDVFAVGTEIDTEYYPVAAICTLGCAINKVADGNTVICLYNDAQNKVAYYLCNSQDDEDIFKYVQVKIAEKEDYLYGLGYRGVHIISNFMEGEFRFGKSLIKFSQADNEYTINVSKFCRYMAFIYCRKNNIETDLLPPYKEDEQLITTAKELF